MQPRTLQPITNPIDIRRATVLRISTSLSTSAIMCAMAKDPYERKRRSWQLQNDITLTIDYAVKNPPNVAAIEEFLSKAMEDFKERRDKLHEQTYTGGSWEAYAVDGRKIRGTGFLRHAGDETGGHLTTDAWVKAIITAYSAANTLSQMKEQLAAYKAALTPDDSWLPAVLNALEKRNGDMDAFELMMKHVEPGQ
jgi:hypothetical protein